MELNWIVIILDSKIKPTGNAESSSLILPSTSNSKQSVIYSQISLYFSGDKIPAIEYTPEEIATWRTVYNELTVLYPKNACQEFNYIFPLLQQNCGFGPDRIPQLQDVSDFLKGKHIQLFSSIVSVFRLYWVHYSSSCWSTFFS